MHTDKPINLEEGHGRAAIYRAVFDLRLLR